MKPLTQADEIVVYDVDGDIAKVSIDTYHGADANFEHAKTVEISCNFRYLSFDLEAAKKLRKALKRAIAGIEN